MMTPPTISPLSEERLDAIEAALRALVPELAQAMNPPLLAWQAADAIAQLRRERVPREPTAEMVQAAIRTYPDHDRLCDLYPAAWRAMYDAAKGSPHD